MNEPIKDYQWFSELKSLYLYDASFVKKKIQQL